jgi:WD40 repeat protein
MRSTLRTTMAHTSSPSSSVAPPSPSRRGRAAESDASARGSYDAFISYSRHDRRFAALLEKALRAYVPPRGLGVPARHLEIFRDESDLTGVDYHAAIQAHLARSSRLIVICSPAARASGYVGEEIRRYVDAKGSENVIPVLLSGRPNNEVAPGQDTEMAFPQALVDAMAMPLAVSYSDFDPDRNDVRKGAFYGAWCTLLANVYGVSKGAVEQRETRRRARRLWTIVATSAAVGTALCIALVVAVLARNQAATERDRAINAIGRIFGERAWQHIDRGDRFLGAKYALAGWRIAASTEADQRLVLASVLQETTDPLAVLPHPSRPVTASFGGRDSDLIVTTAEDGAVRLWNWRTGKEVRTFTRHELRTTSAVFGQGGSTVVSTSDDATARIWDVDSASEVVPPLEHSRPVVCASVSPDGLQIITLSRMAAVAGDSFGLDAWNATDGMLFWSTSPRAAVLTADFMPDSNGVVDILEDGTAEFRDRRSGKVSRTQKFVEGVPTAATVAAVHDLVVLAHGNMARVFRLATGEELAQLRGGGGTILALAIDPSGSTVAAGGDDGIVRTWDVTGGYRVAAQVGHEGEIVHVGFSGDGSRLVTVSTDNTVRVWKASRTVARLGAGGEAALAFSLDGSRLALATATRLDVIEASSLGLIARRDVEPSEERDILALSFSDDATTVMTVPSTGDITAYPANGGAETVVYRAGSLFAAAVSPGGRWAAFVRFENGDRVVLLDVAAKKDFVLSGQSGGVVRELSFSADGSRLAAGAQDGWVSVWDTAARKPIMTIEGHGSPSGFTTFDLYGGVLRAAALNEQGTLVAYALSDGTIQVRDVQTKRNVSVLRASDPPDALAFSSDGRLLAAGGAQGANVWDVLTGRWLASFGKPTGSVAFGPTGRFLVAGGGSFVSQRNENTRRFDSVTEVWDIARLTQPMQVLAQAACTALLARDMHRFSDIELAADSVVRQIWGRRSPAEQSVCG